MRTLVGSIFQVVFQSKVEAFSLSLRLSFQRFFLDFLLSGWSQAGLKEIG